MKTNVSVIQANPYKAQQRVHRKPVEYFNLKSRPWEIVPFMCHPVLPGESLDNAFHQSSVVSDPVANRLIGWYKEYHYFYIPIRAFMVAGYITEADFNDLFLNPTFNIAGASSNSVEYYTFKEGAQWVYLCHTHVVDRYFRDEDDSGIANWDAYPIAQVSQNNWAHSLKEESAGADDPEAPGVDELEELDILPGFTTHYSQWELMRDQGMTDLTYREFLKSYGITPPKEVIEEPTAEAPMVEAERIRSIQKWSNPTLAPQVGSANTSSVMYWRCAERFTKRRFFGEPGFIYGVTVTRPKIYLGNQKGHAVGLLKNAYSWLPAVLNHLPYTSLQENLDSATDGIIQGSDEDYWLDVKDIFLRGGQMVNHAMGAAANHGLALPEVGDLNKKYVTEAMMNSLFTTSDGSASYIYEDGSVHLDIMGKLRETSPGTGTAT